MFIGSLSGDILAGYISQAQWYWYVSGALIGFISGLAFLKTHGRYHMKSAISIAVLISFLGILVGNFFLASADFITNHSTISGFSSEFIALMFTNVIGSLIPLVIFLIIDERFVSREEQKAHGISGTRANETKTDTEHS